MYQHVQLFQKIYVHFFCIQYKLIPTITEGDALVRNVKYSAREMCIWRPTISSTNFEVLLWTAKCRWRTVFRFLQDYFHSSSPPVHCLHFSTCTRKMHSDNKMTDCFILSGEWAESIKQSIAGSFGKTCYLSSCCWVHTSNQHPNLQWFKYRLNIQFKHFDSIYAHYEHNEEKLKRTC